MNKVAAGVAAALALAFTLPAIAQTPAGKRTAIPKGVFYAAQLPGEILAKDKYIGAKVHNASGQIVGDIEDLILDKDNRVIGVIMGVGGFLSMGEKRVGVRVAALRFTMKDGAPYVLLPTMTKEILTAVPEYKRAAPPKSLIERSKEKAREMYERSSETAKDAADKVKEMVQPTTPSSPTPAPTTSTPPTTPPAATPPATTTEPPASSIPAPPAATVPETKKE
jgi:hypothetical protein